MEPVIPDYEWAIYGGLVSISARNPTPMVTPERLNQSQSADIMHDALVCAGRFSMFNVAGDSMDIENYCTLRLTY